MTKKYLDSTGLAYFWGKIKDYVTGVLPTNTSDLINDSGYISSETDPVFTASAAHGISSSDISAWNGKSDFSGDYDDLSNKPTIPSKTSDLNNDSGFATQTYVDEQDDADRGSIFFGTVDNTSTATAFTATINGITEYHDGLAVMLKNGVVTSAAGFTIDINGLGAKPSYNNMALATADTTIFNTNYTMLFIYDSTRVEGGAWVCYRGYNSNDNTIGYQVRTNSSSLPMKSVTYRYRLLFTSADGLGFVPSTNSTSTNATASRTVCQDKIDPFGRIVYYGTTASVAAGTRPSATTLWEQYTLTLGYSFNRTGAALTLTSWKPIYVKCAPQTDGSAIIDSTTPYVQDLPTTADGKIYIMLGVAYSATAIELFLEHPVYYYIDGSIRLWTNPRETSVTETDPIFTSSAAYGISSSDITAWNGKSDFSGDYDDLTNKPTIPSNTSDLNNDSGFITGYTETDPVFTASAAHGITSSDITAWNGKATGNGRIFYGTATMNSQTCNVSCPEYDALTIGDIIVVRFNGLTVPSDASNLKMSVNGTTATTMVRRLDGSTVYFPNGQTYVGYFIYTFIYTGDRWMCIDYNTNRNIAFTEIPNALYPARYDGDAHMNSEDMSAQDVQDFVDDLDVTGVNVVDFVVEQGTSGDWTYRKWNSGLADCWYRGNYGNVTLSTQLSTDIVSAMMQLTFPFTFTEVPSCVIGYEGSPTGYSSLQYPGTQASTTKSQGFRLVRIGTSSVTLANCTFTATVHGKWK